MGVMELNAPRVWRREWRLALQGMVGRLRVVRREDLRPDESTVLIPYPFLHGSVSLTDPLLLRALQEMAEAVGCGRFATAEHVDRIEDIRPCLECAFQRGRLVAIEEPPPPITAASPTTGAGGGGQGGGSAIADARARRQQREAEERRRESARKEAVKTWVEIVLLDEDDVPVAGEPYKLVLPDGTTRYGTLDKDGKAREDNIDPGTCQVSFPRIHGEEWRRV